MDCVILAEQFKLPHIVFPYHTISDLSSLGKRHTIRLNVIVYKTMLVSTTYRNAKRRQFRCYSVLLLIASFMRKHLITLTQHIRGGFK